MPGLSKGSASRLRRVSFMISVSCQLLSRFGRRPGKGSGRRSNVSMLRCMSEDWVMNLPTPPPIIPPVLDRTGASPDAIISHYDKGEDFFELVLGPELIYSCALFEGDDDLATAQRQ